MSLEVPLTLWQCSTSPWRQWGVAGFQRVCDPASSLQPLRVHRAPLLAFCAAAPLRMVLRVAAEVWVTELSLNAFQGQLRVLGNYQPL